MTERHGGRFMEVAPTSEGNLWTTRVMPRLSLALYLPARLPPRSPLPPAHRRLPVMTPVQIYDGANGEAPHFWDYWGVLVRHRWTVIAVFLVVVMAAMVQTFTTRPIYTARATLRLEKEDPRVVKFEEVVRTDPRAGLLPDPVQAPAESRPGQSGRRASRARPAPRIRES